MKVFTEKYIIAESGCWEWQRCLNKAGYGIINYKQKNYLAHRFSWMMKNGDIKNRLHVLHKCDNRSCVNPDHLFLGDQSKNNKDCASKGRHRNGNTGKTICKRGHDITDPQSYYLDSRNGKHRKCKKCYEFYYDKRKKKLKDEIK